MTNKQMGFTLVEFMIATILSVVVIGIGLGMYRDSALANSAATQNSDMDSNLRTGMNLIVRDLVQTGTGIPTGGIPIPNTTDAAGCNKSMPVNRPPVSLDLTFQGPNANNSGCNVVLPAIEPGASLGPAVTSPDGTTSKASDIITILYADNTLALSQKAINGPTCPNGTIAADGSSVAFDATCATLGLAGVPVNVGDLIMFSNVGGNCIQTVTAVNGQTLSFAVLDPFNLNGRTATEAAGTIRQLQNVTNGLPDGTYPPTSATRVWMITYFLDSTTDSQHPRLMREVNFNKSEPVAESIEYAQFLYNLADGAATPPVRQASIPNSDNENEVRAVNVYLSARSPRVSASTFKYARSSLATQVALRSMAYFNTYK